MYKCAHPVASIRTPHARLNFEHSCGIASLCIAVALLLLVTSQTRAALKIWDPVLMSSNWNDDANWFTTGEPGTDDIVSMDANNSIGSTVTLSADTELINSLTLLDGTLATSGHQVIVSDTGDSGQATIQAGSTLLLNTDDAKAADFDRLDVFGDVLFAGTGSTELEVDTTLTIESGGLVRGWGIIDGDIVNNGTLTASRSADTTFSTLTINGDVTNNGTIDSVDSAQFVFNGLVTSEVPAIFAEEIHFGTTGGFMGSGVIGSRITSSTGSTITATHDLVLGGLTQDTTQIDLSGALVVGSHTVMIQDFDRAEVSTVTINGGTLRATLGSDGIRLRSGHTMTANGIVDGALETEVGSTVTTNGTLELGDASHAQGALLNGTLEVGHHQVTLLDATQASLGSVTTIDGGTLSAANGILLGDGESLTGVGTIDSAFESAVGSTINVSSAVPGTSLTLGDASSATGVSIAGALNIGQQEAILLDSDSARLIHTTTLDGGTLTAANGIRLPAGASLVGSGLVDARVSTDHDAVITVDGNLTLGANHTLGISMNGTLNTASHTVTLIDSDGARLGLMTTLDEGTLIAANGISIGNERTLSGTGLVDASVRVFTGGTIDSGDGKLTFSGIITSTGTSATITGHTIEFLSGGGFQGHGSIDARIDAEAGSTIEATDTLSLGLASSAVGVSIDGALDVNGETVTLLDFDTASLGLSTTIDGGTLEAANGISLSSGDAIAGTGTVNADIQGVVTITAGSGTLTLNGDQTFNDVSTINQSAVSTVRLNGSLNVLADTTISVDNLDWDGDGAPTANSTTTISNGSKLTIDVERIDSGDPADDGYDDAIVIDGGTLEVIMPDPWLMDGFLTLDSSSATPRIEGSDMRVRQDFFAGSGSVDVIGGGTAQIAAPLVLESTATVDIAAGTELELQGISKIQDATVTGGGTSMKTHHSSSEFSRWFPSSIRASPALAG